jgi:hypothetical protein
MEVVLDLGIVLYSRVDCIHLLRGYYLIFNKVFCFTKKNGSMINQMAALRVDIIAVAHGKMTYNLERRE